MSNVYSRKSFHKSRIGETFIQSALKIISLLSTIRPGIRISFEAQIPQTIKVQSLCASKELRLRSSVSSFLVTYMCNITKTSKAYQTFPIVFSHVHNQSRRLPLVIFLNIPIDVHKRPNNILLLLFLMNRSFDMIQRRRNNCDIESVLS